MSLSSLRDVVQANLCAGCGICEALDGQGRVQMEISSDGFYRPRIHDDAPEIWRRVKQVCPGVVVDQDSNHHPRGLERLWGPVQSIRVGHSTDPEVRWRASSGGVLSGILIYLLESGIVDQVIHIGPQDDEPFVASVHKSRTRDQILANAGSRYAPTAPLVGVNEWLREDRVQYAFVGKPCDVAALRAYGKLNPDVGQRIRVLVSFLCAGTSSLLATYDLIESLGIDRDRVQRLRYRGFGWPGKTTIEDKAGQEYSMSYGESWGQILGRQLQFRCKICPDGVGGLADIVCGDAWYARDGHPSFEEKPGRSLVIARTTKGHQILQDASSAGHCEFQSFDLRNLALIQPSQRNRHRAVGPRLFALWLARRPFPTYRGFHLLQNAFDAGPWASAKQFGGMLRRLI